MFSVDQAAICSLTKADIPEVKKFVNQIFRSDGDCYEISWYEGWIERWGNERIPVVLMAKWQEQLIGVAVVHNNTFHPHWIDIMVSVHQNFRRQGLGKRLHEALLQSSPFQPHHSGTDGSYYKGNDEAESFLFSMGYQHILDCHCLELNIENSDFSRWLTLPLKPELHHLKIVSCADLFTMPAMQQKVFDFLVSRYGEEHFWSPPQPSDHPDWQEIVFDGVLPELSFALVADDVVVGAATARATGDDTLDMIWGYVDRQYSIDTARSLLQSLYAHQFKAARDRGLTKAGIEVDTTDLVLSSLLDWFPTCDDQVWRVLQKPRTQFNQSGVVD